MVDRRQEEKRTRERVRKKNYESTNHKTILPICLPTLPKNDRVTRYVGDDVCKFLEIINLSLLSIISNS